MFYKFDLCHLFFKNFDLRKSSKRRIETRGVLVDLRQPKIAQGENTSNEKSKQQQQNVILLNKIGNRLAAAANRKKIRQSFGARGMR